MTTVTTRPLPFRSLARAATLAALALLMGACVTAQAPEPVDLGPDPRYVAMYDEKPDEAYPIAATDISNVDPRFLRREVPYRGPYQPGTVVVDTANRFLYLVRENGRALRYGIGVGKEGLAWSGTAEVGRKATWPRWTPTAAMIRREPERNAPWAGGMPPGPENPLGPRALYLYQNGRDTLYRIHGTSEPDTIGTAVSSGCIRMFNQDVVDLFARVPVGSRVVVIQNAPPTDPFEDMPEAELPVASAPVRSAAFY